MDPHVVRLTRQWSVADLSDKVSPRTGLTIQHRGSTFWNSVRLANAVGFKQGATPKIPSLVHSLSIEFAVTFSVELIGTSMAAEARSLGSVEWGFWFAAFFDVLVRIGFAYARLGGIALPHFACAMVTNGDLRAEHCVLIIVTELLAVLLGRWALLMALPSTGAVGLLPESLNMAFGTGDARVWYAAMSRLWGNCSIVTEGFDVPATWLPMLEWKFPLTLEQLGVGRFFYHLSVSALFCSFVFNSVDWCGRFAPVALAAVGTFVSYVLALMNPAWGVARALLECDNAQMMFFPCASGAILGGFAAGYIQRSFVIGAFQRLLQKWRTSDSWENPQEESEDSGDDGIELGQSR